jgi:hypothetical protein
VEAEHHPMKARVCLVMMAGLVACGDTAQRAEYLERDSAGVHIVESPAAMAERWLGWSIADSPEVDIGVAEGDSAYMLYRISGAARLPDGRILVVNGGTQQLRFFDASGGFLRNVGGRGDGPGEFRFPELIPSMEWDSLRVFDRGSRLLKLLTIDGEFAGSWTVRAPITEAIGFAGDRLIFSTGTARAGLDSPEGIVSNDIVVQSIAANGPQVDTIVVYAGQHLFLGNQARQISFTQVPFEAAPSAALGRDRLYATPGRHAEVHVYNPDVGHESTWRVLRPAEPVTRPEFESAVERVIAGLRDPSAAPEMRRRYSKMNIPAARPAFVRLLVDEAAHVWAEDFRVDPASPRQWTVFDTQGRAIGRISTPAALTIDQIGTDFVLGWLRDELDVEHVRLYRLKRDEA